ncbi:hypothetical protein CLAFUW4_06257 [Fulvia fulva]|uniref:AMP-dependent synthetase/ligase domain-containing protein n=1 Tax=Passalora fulva TaxID=5499 RepID=A0A9Q8LHK3_PASFU|nr:uncharacterized protein CLAFUR5_06400 [Fulvia fulva]KAK4624098.1 hypothetical protein CLAFUR4_06260 [Fulvia fulva]KAK4625291.1 hypothetical protein CLAFUR0_06264 [Fulvia fulva]UJO17538.1 hypothetical protein CLAFUR5_06400 [Fulvia fulva]WPV15455.1 hypothetical protein CLAFUW4_06257 [Fulvia fulva]WPV30339.1 hypothetical protein CLAFUW7_06253 [Fulvia fulva]
MPKKVVMTQSSFTCIDATKRLDNPCWSKMYTNATNLSLFPFFQAGGFLTLLAALAYRGVVALLPPGPPLNAQTVAEVVQAEDITTANLMPGVVADIANDPRLLPIFDKISYVATGGGPLPATAGALVAKKDQPANLVR